MEEMACQELLVVRGPQVQLVMAANPERRIRAETDKAELEPAAHLLEVIEAEMVVMAENAEPINFLLVDKPFRVTTEAVVKAQPQAMAEQVVRNYSPLLFQLNVIELLPTMENLGLMEALVYLVCLAFQEHFRMVVDILRQVPERQD